MRKKITDVDKEDLKDRHRAGLQLVQLGESTYPLSGDADARFWMLDAG